jgi:hypothetical protein
VVNFSWYGGINALGYSPVSPSLMWMLSPRLAGVLAAVVATGALTLVLVRTGARRPVPGGVLLAVVSVGNLVSGRITFGIGVAFGALAMAALVAAAPRRALRLTAAAALAALASLASPVAGLFTGLAAGALLLADLRFEAPRPTPALARAATTGADGTGAAAHDATADPGPAGDASGERARSSLSWPVRLPGRVRPGPRLAEALTLGLGAAAGILVTVALSDGGAQPFDAASMRLDVVLALVVVLVVPAAYRAVRVGAVLAIGLLLFTFYVPTAIGANATRLPMLFAVPVVAAYAAWRWLPLTALLVAMVWWQPPVLLNDLTQAGAPETHRSFFAPLNAELDALGGATALGRVEVVPLRDHWESYYVGRRVPLARGWERQVDVERNPLFYTGRPLTPEDYGAWLRASAVTYVAVAPEQPLDVYARGEAAVVLTFPAYLRPVWSGGGWLLFAVAGTDPFVTGGSLAASSTDALRVVSGDPATPMVVKVRWSRWLTVDGGACLAPAPGGWTEVRDRAAGRSYRISSGLRGSGC